MGSDPTEARLGSLSQQIGILWSYREVSGIDKRLSASDGLWDDEGRRDPVANLAVGSGGTFYRVRSERPT